MCLSKDLSADQESQEEADHVGDVGQTEAEGGQTAGQEPQSVSLQTFRSAECVLGWPQYFNIFMKIF